MLNEGGLQSPIRHPIAWQNSNFYDENLAFKEAERIFDICHGCRLCFNLCDSFPKMFDAIDKGKSGEIDGLNRKDYWTVVNHCYLCDMCFPKCPYVPPHFFDIDFPSLMLRLKAINYKKNGASVRDEIISRTDLLGKLNSNFGIAYIVNFFNLIKIFRFFLEKVFGIARKAYLPKFRAQSFRSFFKNKQVFIQGSSSKIALFVTCYGNYNVSEVAEDLTAVYKHNNINVKLLEQEKCCGMPRWEMGDVKSVAKSLAYHLPGLLKQIDLGYEIVVLSPSCAFMLKDIWPLIGGQHKELARLKGHIFDPFEYLVHHYKRSLLRLDFKKSLGQISYHIPCHLRAQNMGKKTREVLSLIPDTKVKIVERCSGHNGTYAMKKEFHLSSLKIAKPVINQMKKHGESQYCSDCMLAANHISLGLGSKPVHPIHLLRQAYAI